MINWQLSKLAYRYPVSHDSIPGSGVQIILARCFFKSSTLTTFGFRVIAGSENFTSNRDFSKSSYESFAFGLGLIYILFKLITYLFFVLADFWTR